MGQKLKATQQTLRFLIKRRVLALTLTLPALWLLDTISSLPIAPVQMLVYASMALVWLAITAMVAELTVKQHIKDQGAPAKRWAITMASTLACGFFVTMAASKLTAALHVVGVMKHAAIIPSIVSIPLQLFGGIAVLFLMAQTAMHYWRSHGETATAAFKLVTPKHHTPSGGLRAASEPSPRPATSFWGKVGRAKQSLFGQRSSARAQGVDDTSEAYERGLGQ